MIPTEELLSDMESLEIYGGKGIGTASPDGNVNCGKNCGCPSKDPDPKPDRNDTDDCNLNCGDNCNCE